MKVNIMLWGGGVPQVLIDYASCNVLVTLSYVFTAMSVTTPIINSS